MSDRYECGCEVEFVRWEEDGVRRSKIAKLDTCEEGTILLEATRIEAAKLPRDIFFEAYDEITALLHGEDVTLEASTPELVAVFWAWWDHLAAAGVPRPT